MENKFVILDYLGFDNLLATVYLDFFKLICQKSDKNFRGSSKKLILDLKVPLVSNDRELEKNFKKKFEFSDLQSAEVLKNLKKFKIY